MALNLVFKCLAMVLNFVFVSMLFYLFFNFLFVVLCCNLYSVIFVPVNSNGHLI